MTPDSERWLQETKATSDLARALVWSKQHPASDLRNDALLATAAMRAQMKSLTYAVDISLNGEPETARLILSDMRAADSMMAALALVVMPPGSSPDGQGLTTEALRDNQARH